MSLKLAVLASGSGTNFQAMVDAVRRGALDADIRLVICQPARREGYRTRKGRRDHLRRDGSQAVAEPRSL